MIMQTIKTISLIANDSTTDVAVLYSMNIKVSAHTSSAGTVNSLKIATGLETTKWENPLTEVTCNNSVVEVLLQVLLN